MTNWISPSEAADMVYDDPAKLGADTDFKFAIYWARGKGGATTSVADLARAKLQPRRPTDEEVAAAGVEWAVTAHDYRLVLAPRTADVPGPRRLFEDYDADVAPGQNITAIVQTLVFPKDRTIHDQMDMTLTYATTFLRPKQLSSLIVQHRAGGSRSARLPHTHIVTLTATADAVGYSEQHSMFADKPAEMHRQFADDWRRFVKAYPA